MCPVPEGTAADAPLPQLATLLPAGTDLTGTEGLVLLAQVPAHMPQTRYQYQSTVVLWPISFHENRPLQHAMDSAQVLASEGDYLYRVMGAAVAAAHAAAAEAAKMSETDKATKPTPVAAAAALGDPRTGRVVTVATDERHLHPLRHAAMLLVEATARTQSQMEQQPKAAKTGEDRVTTNGANGNASDGEKGASGELQPHLCSNLDLFVTHEPCPM